MEKLLYVDVLNFSEEMGFVTKLWNLQYPTERIKAFVEAARHSGYKLKVFIDAGIESESALKKWRTRREEEVLREYKDVPCGLSILVGDIFRLRGVEVGYSPVDHDNDDCIAAHAQADGGDVLSNDRDFFNYVDRRFKIYGSFSIEEGRLILDEKKPPRQNPKYPAPTLRAIIAPPVMLKHSPSFNAVKTQLLYRRGAPTSLVKLLGNPHGNYVKLRACVYHKLGITEPVLEEWPEWDSKSEKVVWHSEKVHPSQVPFSDVPLDTIPAARINGCTGIGGHERSNYLFTCTALELELVIVNEDNQTTLYEEMCKRGWYGNIHPDARTPVEAVCHNWSKDGKCFYGEKCVAKEGHHNCRAHEAGTCRRGKYCRYHH